MSSNRKNQKRSADGELKHRLDALNRDYTVQRGQPFTHFFCPILHRDEDVEIIHGHVINEKFGTCGTWVPQRKDIDNFYGTAAEADFVSIIEDRNKEPIEIFVDPKLSRKHRPHIEVEGQRIDHYLTPEDSKQIAGHTQLEIRRDDGVPISNVTFKVPSNELAALPLEKMKLIFEKDYRPAVVASVLKAAHLTLFEMLGYRYVLSPSGFYLSDILARFFNDNIDAKREVLRENLTRYFRQFVRMVIPITLTGSWEMKGTVIDRRVTLCFGASGAIFAMGVIIKAADATFCAFLPDDNPTTMDTYFGFLKEPPPSIAVRLGEWSNGDEHMQEPHWNVATGDPKRVAMPSFT